MFYILESFSLLKAALNLHLYFLTSPRVIDTVSMKHVQDCSVALLPEGDHLPERSYVLTNELLHSRTRCIYPSYILGIIPLPCKPMSLSQESFGIR